MSYKYNGEISEITVTQTSLAKWLECSQQRVSQMVANGDLVRDEFDKTGRVKLAESLRFYYLSKADVGDEASYWKEKALREKINRKRDALKLKKEEGSAYDAQTVEMALIELLTNLRTQLLGLPAKFAVQLEGKNRDEIYNVMTLEIENRLQELSEYDPQKLNQELEEVVTE